MIILTAMATLSNRAAIARLGVRGWKRFMRLGYVAYLALVVRAALLEGDVWLTWLADPVWLPPPRLLLSMFATMVLLSRLALAIGPAAMLDCRRPGR